MVCRWRLRLGGSRLCLPSFRMAKTPPTHWSCSWSKAVRCTLQGFTSFRSCAQSLGGVLCSWPNMKCAFLEVSFWWCCLRWLMFAQCIMHGLVVVVWGPGWVASPTRMLVRCEAHVGVWLPKSRCRSAVALCLPTSERKGILFGLPLSLGWFNLLGLLLAMVVLIISASCWAALHALTSRELGGC